jgi:hypothetical protein
LRWELLELEMAWSLNELVKEDLEEFVKTHLVDLNKLKSRKEPVVEKHLFDPSKLKGRKDLEERSNKKESFYKNLLMRVISLFFFFLFLCVYFSLFFLFLNIYIDNF